MCFIAKPKKEVMKVLVAMLPHFSLLLFLLLCPVFSIDLYATKKCSTDKAGNKYGTFRGTVLQADGSKYDMIVEYTSKGIKTNYTRLNCGNKRNVRLTEVRTGVLKWTEKLDYGLSSCIDNGSCTIKRVKQRWMWYYSGSGVTATSPNGLTLTCVPRSYC